MPFHEEVHQAILRMTDAGLRFGTDSPEYIQARAEYLKALEQEPFIPARRPQPVNGNDSRPGLLKRLARKFKLSK